MIIIIIIEIRRTELVERKKKILKIERNVFENYNIFSLSLSLLLLKCIDMYSLQN
jgi:hypothetical protein